MHRLTTAAGILAVLTVLSAGCRSEPQETSPADSRAAPSAPAQASGTTETATETPTETPTATPEAAPSSKTPPPLPGDVQSIVARAREALAGEMQVRTTVLLTGLGDGKTTVRETTLQGGTLAERSFKLEGCPEDPEDRCTGIDGDYVRIGSTIWTYQGGSAWTSVGIEAHMDAFQGLEDVLQNLASWEAPRVSGSDVTRRLDGEGGTVIDEVLTFDALGRPVELHNDVTYADPAQHGLSTVIRWDYDAAISPIAPPAGE